MTHNLSLGAINKQTGEYVYPKIANKKDDYICPDCNKELILCQGGIIRPYFRHKVDSVNPCHHYSNPTETQIHKDGKMVIKSLLERKIPISFIRNCCSCKKNEKYEMPGMTESSKIELEYRFEYNGTKIADVVYIDNGDILCIFEICNTHKTCSENRPEPWFEIDAETLIKLANDSSSQIKIPCIRCEKCDGCIEKEKIQLKITQLIEDISNLNKTLETITGWGATNTEKNKKSKIRKKIRDLEEELSLLNNDGASKTEFTKEQKINTLNQELNNIGASSAEFRSNIDIDDDADTFRSMRYANQDRNHRMSFSQEMIFITNDIKYVLLNNVISIEHPSTHIKIRRSLVNNKTYYKGEWRRNISIDRILKWYQSKSEFELIHYY